MSHQCLAIFSFLRDLNTDFYSDWTNLHSHQQCIRVPLPLAPPSSAAFVVCFLIKAFSKLRWYLPIRNSYCSSYDSALFSISFHLFLA
jgi:hypothetical protein